MKYLLDTNAVIAATKDPAGKVACRAMAQAVEDVAVSSLVMFELFYGVHRSHPASFEANMARCDALSFEVMPFDVHDARVAGELRELLRKAGTPIGPYDLLMAAQAVARDLILVTNNTREFERVSGLRFEDWTL